MQQARLIIIADHGLDIKDKESIMSICLQTDIKETLQNALNIQANLENYKEPDMVQAVVFNGTDSNGDLHFSVNEIEMRISKHLIQFRFPFIFRVIVDYMALRNAYYQFLHFFLLPFQTTELIEFPSFWEQKPHEIKNDWHQRRLKELQHKLVYESTSFKRSKLNLEHCLGVPASDAKKIMADKYRVWILLDYNTLLEKASSDNNF